MRVFDRILREEAENNYTGIEDIKYIAIRPEVLKQLVQECITEFELEQGATISNIIDNMGVKIIPDESLAEDFKFIIDE